MTIERGSELRDLLVEGKLDEFNRRASEEALPQALPMNSSRSPFSSWSPYEGTVMHR